MEIGKKKRNNNLNNRIAAIVKCHPVYVCRVLTGDVPANKGKAMKIKEAARLLERENFLIEQKIEKAINPSV